MNDELQERMVYILNSIICSNIPEFYKYKGLCRLLINAVPWEKTQTFEYWLYNQFISWDKFSGILEYPVPHTACDPATAYHRTKDKYTGEYGKLRLELAQHLLNNVHLIGSNYDIL